MMHDLLFALDSRFHATFDWGVATLASAVLAISWFNVIDGAERLVTGALVVVLVFLRIRSHLRRDRAERLTGRQ